MKKYNDWKGPIPSYDAALIERLPPGPVHEDQGLVGATTVAEKPGLMVTAEMPIAFPWVKLPTHSCRGGKRVCLPLEGKE